MIHILQAGWWIYQLIELHTSKMSSRKFKCWFISEKAVMIWTQHWDEIHSSNYYCRLDILIQKEIWLSDDLYEMIRNCRNAVSCHWQMTWDILVGNTGIPLFSNAVCLYDLLDMVKQYRSELMVVWTVNYGRVFVEGWRLNVLTYSNWSIWGRLIN